MTSAPIGVFDSGHGGLTILRGLVARLPQASFLYLGDHAAAPYGKRSPAEIYARTESAVALLFALGCRLVLLACNTAAAVALRPLQQGWLAERYPDHRVLGVLVPLVEHLAQAPWSLTGAQPKVRPAELVALFGTPRTVESGAYPREVALRAPAVEIAQQACDGLAAAIEADASLAELTRLVQHDVAALLTRLQGRLPDSAALACTHYPLVEPLFRAALPARTLLLSQPDLTAASLADYLVRHPQFSSSGSQLTFLTTGDPGYVTPLATRFFGRAAPFQQIKR